MMQATDQSLSCHFKFPPHPGQRANLVLFPKPWCVSHCPLVLCVCSYLGTQWGTQCTGKNTGNQETGSIPGQPPISHVTSESHFTPLSLSFLTCPIKGLDDMVLSVPSCSDIWQIYPVLCGHKPMRLRARLQGLSGKLENPSLDVFHNI